MLLIFGEESWWIKLDILIGCVYHYFFMSIKNALSFAAGMVQLNKVQKLLTFLLSVVPRVRP